MPVLRGVMSTVPLSLLVEYLEVPLKSALYVKSFHHAR
jgi:hypothetical protein